MTAISIHPLTVGAEVLGFDRVLDPTPAGDEARATLHQAWLDYGLLLCRGVHSVETHLALSRCLGELEKHPLEQMRAEESDWLMPVGDEISRFWVYDEAEVKSGTIPWHRDTAYTPSIAKGAMLRIVATPPAGGETYFCDTARAYDDLSDELKERVEHLEYRSSLKATPMEQTGPGAIWDSVRPLTDEEVAELGLEPSIKDRPSGKPLPPVVHPAVLTHPESGRRCLFLSPKEFDYFLGMDRAESDALFAQLVAHVLQDRYVYKHTWAVDDAMAWDNRRFMHAAAGSYVGDHRKGLRTTLAGDWAIGRLADDHESV